VGRREAAITRTKNKVLPPHMPRFRTEAANARWWNAHPEAASDLFGTRGVTQARSRAGREHNASMWRFGRSNAITEGFHNKLEIISRQAYGFRNFENYRLRVKVLCG